MTGSQFVGLLIIASLVWLVRKWSRWSKARLARQEWVSGNTRAVHDKPVPVPAKSGRMRKAHTQDRPMPECFDDNDAAWDAEMEDDL